MKNFSLTDQDFSLWWLLVQTRDIILKARRKELHRHNISGRNAATLFVIQSLGDNATPAEISRWILREPHSISEILSRMEKQGLLRKIRNLPKRNMVRVVLTEKGREAYYQSTKRGSIHKIMSCLSEEEHQQLRSSLLVLRNKALKELEMEYQAPFPPS